MDVQTSISSPLLKTKVLASRLKNEPLLNWASNELAGYVDVELPAYRQVVGIVECSGQIVEPLRRYEMSNYQIPLKMLDQELISALENHNFYESISTLENMIVPHDMQAIYHPFSAEAMGYIQNKWSQDTGLHIAIYSLYRKVSRHSIVQLLSSVRNELLDFMLKIDDEFGNITKIEDLRLKNEQITYIMNNTINTTGDGNVINTGDNNTISNTVNISKGSKDDLIKYLESLGCSNDEAVELTDIIDTDNHDHVNKSFGANVNAWIVKMLSKTGETAAKIGIGASGGLIAGAIKSYLGWH